MEVPLLLALLFGAVSAFHLSTETSNVEIPLGEENLSQEGEMLEQEAKGLSTEELPQLEEASGDEDAPEEEGAMDSNLGCRRFLLVREPSTYTRAQFICQTRFRGNLVSIHHFSFNLQIQNIVRNLNQGQVWIGGQIIGQGNSRCFRWVDGSSWNFAYWAAGQPAANSGRCVTLCTKGGRWRRANCERRLPFVCSF